MKVSRLIRSMIYTVLAILSHVGSIAYFTVTQSVLVRNLISAAILAWLSYEFYALIRNRTVAQMAKLSFPILAIVVTWFLVRVDQISAYTYAVEMLLENPSGPVCASKEIVAVLDSVIEKCFERGFTQNQFYDVILKVSGSQPGEDILSEVNAGSLDAGLQSKLGSAVGLWPYRMHIRKVPLHEIFLVRVVSG